MNAATVEGELMTKTEYIEFHRLMCDKMIEITKKKNSDYCAGEDPFGNFRQIGGMVNIPSVVEVGFLTRMSDKMSRIGSFITNGTLEVKDESAFDTLLDLANYSILFAGYLESMKSEKTVDQMVNKANENMGWVGTQNSVRGQT